MNLDVNPTENFDGSPKEEPKIESKTEEKAIATVQQLRPATISADERGLLRGASLEDQYRLARYYAQSGLMPRALNTPEKILVALQLCAELGLPPMTSVGKIAVINSTPSLFGDLPLAIVRRSGLLGGLKETWLRDDKNEILGAKCWAKRKDTGEEIEREFNLSDAKRANLLSKDPWKFYPSRMLQCRARAWCLKDLFGDVLGGISIGEYDLNSTIEDGEVVGTEGQDLAARFNDAYPDKENEVQK